MKIFLSTSFSSGKLDMDGTVLPEYRAELEGILAKLREAGFTVFNAIEQMDWTKSHNPPEQKTKELLTELEGSDLVVAMVSDIISAGVQLEIGYAVAKGIPVAMATMSAASLPYVNQGIVNLNLAAPVVYEDVETLVQQIAELAKTLSLQPRQGSAAPEPAAAVISGTDQPASASDQPTFQEVVRRLSAQSSPNHGAAGLAQRGVVAPPVHPPTPVTALSKALADLPDATPEASIPHVGEFDAPPVSSPNPQPQTVPQPDPAQQPAGWPPLPPTSPPVRSANEWPAPPLWSTMPPAGQTMPAAASPGMPPQPAHIPPQAPVMPMPQPYGEQPSAPPPVQSVSQPNQLSDGTNITPGQTAQGWPPQ